MLVGAPTNVPGAEITSVPAADDYGVRAVERAEDIDWSRHERDAMVGGRRLHYVEIGSGEHTVVLVHGFSASWRVWIDVMPALAKRYRVIAFDLPGMGDSESGVDARMSTLQAPIVEWLAKLAGDGGPVTIVGHSMGTLVATEIAAEAPELVGRVILIGGPCTSAVRVVKQPTYVLKAPNLVGVLIEVALGQLSMPKWFRNLVVRRPWVRAIMLRAYAHRPGRIAAAMVANLLHGFGSPGNHAVVTEARTYDYGVAARATRCPFFVVHGDKDLLVPPADVEQLARMAWVKQVVVLRETGHNPEIERPNTLNSVLLQILDEDVSREPLRGESFRPSDGRPERAVGIASSATIAAS